MKVLLIRPPFYAAFGSETKIGNIPLGLLSIAASLEKVGHTVEIMDCESLDLAPREMVGHSEIARKLNTSYGQFSKVLNDPKHLAWQKVAVEIVAEKPDLVGFTGFTASFNFIKYVIRLLRKLSDIPVLIGGPHVTALPVDSLKESGANIAVIGEGEKTSVELMDWLENGRNHLKLIKGAAFYNGFDVEVTWPRARIKDLDSLPFPARNLLDRELYDDEAYGYIVTSRGCPHNCLFCASRTMWGRHVTFRSMGNVVDEIELCNAYYGTTVFRFVDDLFTVTEKRVRRFAKELKDRKLDIRFRCESRVDTVDKERISLLKESGCERICFGLETGSQRLLDIIRKKTTIEQAVKAVGLAKEAGIKVTAYFIVGHPTETWDDISLTLRLIEKLDVDRVTLNMLTPLPGSDLIKQTGTCSDWARYFFQGNTLSSLSALSDEDLNFVYRKMGEVVARKNARHSAG